VLFRGDFNLLLRKSKDKSFISQFRFDFFDFSIDFLCQ
jgi:hypothetical protein